MRFFKRKRATVSEVALTVPEHLAIIMDGNGRWAKKRYLPRQAGHRAGADNLKKMTEIASNLGVRYLSVYAFSTENWKRPSEEVEALMGLFTEFLRRYDAELERKQVRLRFMGRRDNLSDEVIRAMEEAEAQSADREGMQLILAFNYGGRDELLRATNRLIEAGQPLRSESQLQAALDLPDVPDPALLIRTSGEYRLSNFMLWQLAYTEVYVTSVLWPDFSEEELKLALQDFSSRQRRYGGL